MRFISYEEAQKTITLKAVKLPQWLINKLEGYQPKPKKESLLYREVIQETEKAILIIGVKDTSRSYNFVNFQYYIEWVSKKLIEKELKTEDFKELERKDFEGVKTAKEIHNLLK